MWNKRPAQGMAETRILNHLSKEIEGIMILADTYIVENIDIHEIERGILSALLNFGRSILSSIISQKVEVVRQVKLVSPGGDAFERKGDCAPVRGSVRRDRYSKAVHRVRGNFN
jgi:hypothetical protein